MTLSTNKSIQRAILYIQKNFRKDIKIRDVANHVYLSEKYFSQFFKKQLGCNFTEYLINLRLKNACHMLTQSNDLVIDIAKDSGFNDIKHFQRTFKKHLNITPLEYRKQNSG